MGHARAIVGIKNPKVQIELADKTIKEQWSVRDLEEAIKNYEESLNKRVPAKKAAKAGAKDPYIHQIEDQLMGIFQTTVKIRQKNDRGKIEFSYYSRDDLERLLELLQVKTS